MRRGAVWHSDAEPKHVGARLANLIDARNDWAGHFSVVEPGRVRMRAFT
jgi:hypothetical protein